MYPAYYLYCFALRPTFALADMFARGQLATVALAQCVLLFAVCCYLGWRQPVALAPFLFSMTQDILLCLPSIRYSDKYSQATGLSPRVPQPPPPLTQYRQRAHRPPRAAPPIPQSSKAEHK